MYIRILIREFLFGKGRIFGIWESHAILFVPLDNAEQPFYNWALTYSDIGI